MRDAPNTEAWIELPPETQLLDGQLEWKGDLFENQTVEISARVLFNHQGDQEVACRAL